MKFRLTHRVSTILATTLATAALATGTATADPLAPEPAPISEYGLGADLTALFMALSMSPGSSALNAGSTELASGSGLTRGYMQFLCQLQYGKWDSATATCKYPVFNPSSAVLDPAAEATPVLAPIAAPLTAEPVATTTGSSGGSADLFDKGFLCRITGQGLYWRADSGCTDVYIPPWVS